MTESNYWSGTVRPALLPYGVAERIENRVGAGFADVNYVLLQVEGWVELKHAREWPRKANTPFRFPHFTIDQLRWHQRRNKAGGRTFMLANIARDHMLIPPWNMEEVHDGCVKARWIALSVVHSAVAFPTAKIVRHLIGKG